MGIGLGERRPGESRQLAEGSRQKAAGRRQQAEGVGATRGLPGGANRSLPGLLQHGPLITPGNPGILAGFGGKIRLCRLPRPVAEMKDLDESFFFVDSVVDQHGAM
jgi:hypothetical protein